MRDYQANWSYLLSDFPTSEIAGFNNLDISLLDPC